MELLTRADIFGAQDQEFEDVPIPEWGGKALRVAAMSGAVREAYEALMRKQREGGADNQVIRASLVAACAVDAKGKPLFDLADVAKLAERNWKALDRACTAAIRLNKLSPLAIEGEAKN